MKAIQPAIVMSAAAAKAMTSMVDAGLASSFPTEGRFAVFAASFMLDSLIAPLGIGSADRLVGSRAWI
jgi:hypothetical protein